MIADDMLETILLDITSEDAIRSVCKSAQINVIINCAAYTDVEKRKQILKWQILSIVMP